MKNKLTIVKIGGNVINDNKALTSFLTDFASIEGLKILVHGGGKKASELAAQIGLTPKMMNGRRVTDEANLDVVTMVYAGLLNKKIVAQLQQYNCNAIGLSGADANSIKAHKRVVKDIDYGYAGDVDEVNDSVIKLLLENNLTPVFCAITHDKNGQLLNTNADTIASEIASGLTNHFHVVLIYCFEKNGVLKDVKDDNSIIENIDSKSYAALKDKNIIADGMLPKLENCFYALNNGVAKIIIGNPSVIVNKVQKYTSLKL
ncbi:MAG: acetylglutamate kinase [Flavobacteriaceae bacterium]|nr:acetylglutamate kinase [Flavobacteriaceae bacterium]